MIAARLLPLAAADEPGAMAATSSAASTASVQAAAAASLARDMAAGGAAAEEATASKVALAASARLEVCNTRTCASIRRCSTGAVLLRFRFSHKRLPRTSGRADPQTTMPRPRFASMVLADSFAAELPRSITAGIVWPRKVFASILGLASSHSSMPQPSFRSRTFPLMAPVDFSRNWMAAILFCVSVFSATSGLASWRASMATLWFCLKEQPLMTPVDLSFSTTAAFLMPVKVLLTTVTLAAPEATMPKLCFEVTVQSVRRAEPRSTTTHDASPTMPKPCSRGNAAAGPSCWNLTGVTRPEAFKLASCPPSLPMTVTGLVRTSSSL
mmetsp:Transcript_93304/g.278581  ORF Transcript_93304/g.278581 Transcript_93304/m.278581 type:complete len:326 (+) Transcript_93304:717-1694(+)